MSGYFNFLAATGNAIKRHPFITAGIFICVLIVVAAGVWFLVIDRPEAGPEVGNLAPDFSWQTSDGEILALHGLQGKVVMLSFIDLDDYRTDEGLLQEISSMQAVRDKRADEELVMLYIVDELSGGAALQEFIGRYDLTFPVLLDSSGEIADVYDILCRCAHNLERVCYGIN
jgi:peroxiredoxin